MYYTSGKSWYIITNLSFSYCLSGKLIKIFKSLFELALDEFISREINLKFKF